jgi:hypothetical protein
MTSLKDTARVGILYNTALAEKQARMLASWFNENGAKVISLGYVDEKELDNEHNPNYKTDYFCRRNLTKLRLPKSADVDRFILEPFDYLICLHKDVLYPILGIAAMSKAKFRVGPYLPNHTHCFDFMLDSKEAGLDYYVEELKNYIKNYGKG